MQTNSLTVKGNPMKRIAIERYKDPEETGYAGLIEGTTDDGKSWIMWIGKNGQPEIFWPDRDHSGAVTEGKGVHLGGPYESVREHLKPKSGEEMVSTFPVWTPEIWPRQEGDDPTDYTGLSRGIVFCVAQPEESPAEVMKAFVRELVAFYDAEESTHGE